MEEIRYLPYEEKKNCRKLWEQAFPEDSESFDNYYFEEKIKDNRILVKEIDGEIGAMLQQNPYQVQVWDKKYSIDYIVGVATDQNRRHQGHMRDLLQVMMKEMRKERVPFTFLMPASELIYRPFDFRFTSSQPVFQLKAGTCLERRKAEVADQETILKAARWMQKWMEENFDVFAVRDEAYVIRLIKELASENGNLDMLYDGDRLVGLEAFWGLGKKEERLLYCDREYGQVKSQKPVMMARIIHMEEFLSMFSLEAEDAGEEMEIYFEVQDKWLPENNGFYRWILGAGGSQVTKTDEGFEEEMFVKASEIQEKKVIVLNEILGPAMLVSYLLGGAEWKETGAKIRLPRIFFDEIV